MAKTQCAEEFVDHYLMLCLPSGEESFKISFKQIDKAFREQSRKRHPDKRPNDPEATADFQRLIKSYKILTDISARSTFDASIREKAFRASCFDAKRRKLISDLEEREHAVKIDPTENAARKEKIVAAELKKELAAFQSHKVPVDLVIDHSVQVDVAKSEHAVQSNMELEFQHHEERIAFLKWG